MNKQDIINVVGSTIASLTKAEAELAVGTVFAEIETALARGEEVRVTGFGTFKRVATKARTCRNPHTGATVEVPAGHKAKFKASSKLILTTPAQV